MRRPLVLALILILVSFPVRAQHSNWVAVLNGDGAHVAFPPELLRGLDEVTLEGWFKWERFASFSPALSAGKPWQMIGFNNWETDPTLQFFLYDTARNLHLIRVSDILELGRWYHLAGVVDDQGLRLYLNGEQVGRIPLPEPLSAVIDADARIVTGQSLWAQSSDFIGRLDNPRFWGAARTAEEIRAGMHASVNGDESGLLAAYDFENGQARDLGPRGLHGTLSNGIRLVEESLPLPSAAPPPAVLTGRVLDARGAPVFQAQVRLEMNGHIPARARSDARGAYRLVLFADDHPYDLAVLWNDTGAWLTNLTIAPSRQALPDLRLQPAVSLSGRVLGLDREPLAGINVQVLATDADAASAPSPPPADRVVATARSDENGRYRFINLKPGSYRVRCLAPGRHLYWRDGGAQGIGHAVPEEASGDLVSIEPDRTVERVDFHAGALREGHWRMVNFMDGLPGNNVLALAEDEAGFLWIGMEYGGAARYDGARFETFTTENGLPDNKINALCPMPGGMVWFGTTGGLARYDGGGFDIFDTKRGLPHDYVECLLPGRGAGEDESVLWIGTRGGLCRWDGRAFQSWSTREGLAGNHVYDLAFDTEGRLWAATDGGASRWTLTGFENFTTGNGLVANSLRAVEIAADGSVWFGSDARGISRFDGRAFTTINDQNGLVDNAIRAIHRARNGSLWIATETGVSRYANEAFLNFRPHDGLSSGETWCVQQTSDDLMWFGTRGGGLAVYDAETFLHLEARSGLAGNLVTSLSRAPGGPLWIGTLGGVSRYHRDASQSFTLRDGLIDARVNAVCALSPDQVWVGTERGASLIEQNQLSPAGSFPELAGLKIKSICRGDGPTAWFAVYGGGLYFYDGTKVGRSEEDAGSGGGFLRSVYRDPSGVLHMAGREITSYSPAGPRRWTASDGLNTAEIFALQTDALGRLWVGTKTGLLRRDEDGGPFAPIDMGHGLDHNTIYSISLARDGGLWFGSDVGLSFFDGTNWSRLDTRDGLLGNQVRATWCDPDGSVWAGTENGLTRYLPNRHTPTARLTGLQTSDGLRRPGEGIRIATGSPASIFFAATDFRTHPDKIQFRCRLRPRPAEGGGAADAAPWLPARPRAAYAWTPTEPGHYEFAVQAVDRDLNYSAPVFLQLDVFTPWPTNPWIVTPLLAGLIALLAGTAFSTWRYSVKRRESALAHARLVAQETFARQVLDQQETERQRIAAEMHDGLGQSLLVLKNRALLGLRNRSNAAQVSQQLEEISATASQAIAEVREIAFNLRPHQLDSLGMEKGIAAMANKVCRAGGLELVSDIEHLSPLLSAEAQIHCFRIVQECLNNVVKHAQASRVWLTFRREDQALRLEVRDNGRGFVPPDNELVPPGSGPGLGGSGTANIAERVKYLHGTLRMDLREGQGAAIQVTIPLSESREP